MKKFREDNPWFYKPAVKSFVLLSLLVLGYFATVIAVNLYMLFANSDIELNQSLYFQFAFFEIIPVIIYLFIYKGDKKIKDILNVRKISFKNFVYIVLLQIFMSPLILLVNYVTTLLWGAETSQAIGSMDISFFEMFFLIGVLGPITEEVIFRGVVFDITKKENLVVMAIISGFAFGAFHMNLNQFSYAFILGYVFTIYVYYTGSIFAAIIPHIIVNGWSVILLFVSKWITTLDIDGLGIESSVDTLGNTDLYFDLSMFLSLLFISVICISVYYVIFVHFKKYNKEKNHFSKLNRIRNISLDSLDDFDF
ncbi:MAG: lysostaphin resistance A-like protein [Lachnospirales bacterium]